jgi:hypothetical protein
MMTQMLRQAALAAATLVLAAVETAHAGVPEGPSLESTCVRSRTMFKAADGYSLSDAKKGVKVPLVRVEICAETRITCAIQGSEVPWSECGALHHAAPVLTTD